MKFLVTQTVKFSKIIDADSKQDAIDNFYMLDAETEQVKITAKLAKQFDECWVLRGVQKRKNIFVCVAGMSGIHVLPTHQSGVPNATHPIGISHGNTYWSIWGMNHRTVFLN